MKKINELKQNPIFIADDEELEAWKSSWDGKSYPPPEVIRYMLDVALPRQDARSAESLKRFMDSLK